jgi:hypothetical protein
MAENDREFCSTADYLNEEWFSTHSRAQWSQKSITRMLDNIWQYPEAENPVCVAEAAETTEERFHKLAAEWSKQTRHISSVSDLINDRRYQEIINLGLDVVPHLLTDLQGNKRFWFPALAAITGVRPFDPGDSNNPRRMTEAWVRWGKRKGLI